MSGEPPLPELLPSPLAEGADPVIVAAEITTRSGTSFGAGMAILPKPRREGMRAVYAFCRVVDDIADGDFPVDDKQAALDAWREEVDRLYAGAPQSAVGLALKPSVEAYDLPKQEFLMMIEGMETDAHGPVVGPTRDGLAAYTRRVAGSVGMLSMRLFGAWRGEISDRFALALGDAFQLTNILRDVEEDAAIGRLYLPKELLEAHGLPSDDPASVARHPGLPEVCREIGAEARGFYDQARALAADHSRAKLRPALLMMGAYEGYLDRMEGMDWRRAPDEELLSKRQKLWRGLKYAFAGPGRAPRASLA